MRNTYCIINLNAVANNLEAIRSVCAPGTKVCAVVKANAYGHGLIRVAETLQRSGVEYLAVAIVDEGVILRKNGITIPILVLAGVDDADMETGIKHDLTLTASSVQKLMQITAFGKIQSKTPIVHLKIDTGMGRIGVHFDRANTFIEKALELVRTGEIICEGMYTHFADALDYDYTRMQFDRFISVLAYARSIGLEVPIAHTCSSRSIFMYPEFHLDMVRPGIALYGIEPETEKSILPKTIIPVLEWKTKVVYFKVVDEQESVGYGRSWISQGSHSRIVTLPVGYADGFPRRLSNCGHVLIRGNQYSIAGRMCMDQVMVSLGPGGTAYLDDEVTLIGRDGEKRITAEMIAKEVGTTPHEITTGISERVPRVYDETYENK